MKTLLPFKSNKGSGQLSPSIKTHKNEVVLQVAKGSELETQISMIGLTEKDLAVALAVQPIIQKNIQKIVNRFYDNIGHEASLLDIINQNSTIDRLKKTLTTHIIEMFSGKIDDAYIQQRFRIAQIHLRIGLRTKWYMCSFQDMLMSILAVLHESIENKEDFYIACTSTTKLVNLEQQIVLEAFDKEIENIREEQLKDRQRVKQKVEMNSAELAAVTEQSSASLQELSAQSQEIVKFAASVAEVTSRVELNTVDGKQRLASQLEQLEGIQSRVHEIAENMKPLRDTSDRIREIAELVKSIADQTNLLALNASIEAARAGEHGRGFAVVAGEVRKLSEQTKDTVEGVTGLIDDIQRQIRTVADDLPEMEQRITGAAGNMKDTNIFFDELVKEMSYIKQQNSQIEQELDSISAVMNDISNAVNQVASSADELMDMAKTL